MYLANLIFVVSRLEMLQSFDVIVVKKKRLFKVC